MSIFLSSTPGIFLRNCFNCYGYRRCFCSQADNYGIGLNAGSHRLAACAAGSAYLDGGTGRYLHRDSMSEPLGFLPRFLFVNAELLTAISVKYSGKITTVL